MIIILVTMNLATCPDLLHDANLENGLNHMQTLVTNMQELRTAIQELQ